MNRHFSPENGRVAEKKVEYIAHIDRYRSYMIRDTSQSQNIDYPSYVRAENRRIRPLHRLKNNGQKRYILNADSLITSVAAAPTHSNANINYIDNLSKNYCLKVELCFSLIMTMILLSPHITIKMITTKVPKSIEMRLINHNSVMIKLII